MSMHHNSGGHRLLDHIERIERLEAQKALIQADIRDAKAVCRADGFLIAAVNQMLKERQWSAEQREEYQVSCEVYRAHLGMLGGTPLGTAARRAFEQARKPTDGAAPGNGPVASNDEPEGAAPENEPVPDAQEGLDEARERGRAAAKAGESVLSNPYTANDPRRASWDEAFCAELGSDGMELPPSLRRSEKKRKKKGSEE